jgi:hypothetical protein
VARLEDESLHHVCPKPALVRMALACRRLSALRDLQSLFHPLPSPVLLQRADEVLEIIRRETAREEEEEEEEQKEQQKDQGDDEKAEAPAAAAAAAAAGPTSLPSSPSRHEADKEMSAAAAPSSSSPQNRPKPAGAPPAPPSAFQAASKGAGSGGGSAATTTSPVLGTEALYLQAGWMTAHEKLRALAGSSAASSSADPSSASDGEGAGGGGGDAGNAGSRSQATARTKNLVAVHPSNRIYQAGVVLPAAWRGAKDPPKRGDDRPAPGGGGVGGAAAASRSVDGMGTVRAARGEGGAAVPGNLEDEMRLARQNSSAVQARLRGSLPSVLGLVTPTIDLLDDDDAAADDGRVRDAGGGAAAPGKGFEDFDVPRSMREIYKISNRNRRNKKAGSPTPERGVTPTTEKEQEELARAEAVLRERGLVPSAYFDEGAAGGGGGSSPGKRARTKSSSGRDSEETVPQDAAALASREDDFAVLRSVGWIPEGATAGRLDSDASKNSAFGFDFAPAGPAGSYDPARPSPNPFFSGAALAGGPLTQGFSKADPRSKKPNPGGRGRQGQGRRQERPEKKDGRTHAYRKR